MHPNLDPRNVAVVVGLALMITITFADESISDFDVIQTTTPSTSEPDPQNPRQGPRELQARERFFGGEIEAIAVVGRPDFRGNSGNAKPPPDGKGGGRPRARPSGDGGPSRSSMAGANAPPKMLTLELVNHGNADARIEIIDFKSKFGNFSVKPSAVTVPAGQSVTVEPMISRLEVYDDEPTLYLRFIMDGVAEERTTVFLPRALVPDTMNVPEAGS